MLDGGVEYWGNGENPYRGHNSPYDRGGADSYYGRPRDPHYYKPSRNGDSLYGYDKVEKEEMNDFQISEYHLGYDENEKQGHKKSWY